MKKLIKITAYVQPAALKKLRKAAKKAGASPSSVINNLIVENFG
jgi:hypothetical protein